MKINLEYDEVIFDKNFRKELFKNKIDNFIRIDYLMFLIFRNLRLMFLFFSQFSGWACSYDVLKFSRNLSLMFL